MHPSWANSHFVAGHIATVLHTLLHILLSQLLSYPHAPTYIHPLTPTMFYIHLVLRISFEPIYTIASIID